VVPVEASADGFDNDRIGHCGVLANRQNCKFKGGRELSSRVSRIAQVTLSAVPVCGRRSSPSFASNSANTRRRARGSPSGHRHSGQSAARMKGSSIEHLCAPDDTF
jgi:hypothetical protein